MAQFSSCNSMQDFSTSAPLTFWTKLFFVISPLQCKMSSSIFGLYPLDANSIPPPTHLELWQSKTLQILSNVPWGQKSPLVENHCSTVYHPLLQVSLWLEQCLGERPSTKPYLVACVSGCQQGPLWKKSNKVLAYRALGTYCWVPWLLPRLHMAFSPGN